MAAGGASSNEDTYKEIGELYNDSSTPGERSLFYYRYNLFPNERSPITTNVILSELGLTTNDTGDPDPQQAPTDKIEAVSDIIGKLVNTAYGVDVDKPPINDKNHNRN